MILEVVPALHLQELTGHPVSNQASRHYAGALDWPSSQPTMPGLGDGQDTARLWWLHRVFSDLVRPLIRVAGENDPVTRLTGPCARMLSACCAVPALDAPPQVQWVRRPQRQRSVGRCRGPASPGASASSELAGGVPTGARGEPPRESQGLAVAPARRPSDIW